MRHSHPIEQGSPHPRLGPRNGLPEEITMKKLTTFAIAATAMLGAAAISAPASAGFKGGFKGGFHHHGHHHHHHHRHWGHRHWGYGVHAIPAYYGGCYWKRSYYGLVKICY
jgi:hypothetical protein